jgi:hypothetical protein
VSKPATIFSVAEVRSGLGWIFMLAGFMHGILMAIATLRTFGMFRHLFIQPGGVYILFISPLYFLIGAAILYLAIKSRSGDVLAAQAIIDLVVGALIFKGLFRLMLALLVRRPDLSWLSLLPSLFLLWYGDTLRRGRQIHSRLDLLS